MPKKGKRERKCNGFIFELKLQLSHVISLQNEMETSGSYPFEGRSEEFRFVISYERVPRIRFEELRSTVIGFKHYASKGWTFTLEFPIDDPAKLCIHYHPMRTDIPFGLQYYKHVELSPALLNTMTVSAEIRDSLLKRISNEEDNYFKRDVKDMSDAESIVRDIESQLEEPISSSSSAKDQAGETKGWLW
jgi:hypothetical protein